MLLSYLAVLSKQPLWGLLGLTRPTPVATSYTMPIMPVEGIAAYVKPLKRFKSLKIKVDADSAKDILFEVKKHTSVKLRIDANEAWKDLDSFLKFQKRLVGMNIEFIEQPFPATMKAEYKELKKKTPFVLMADESIEDVADFALLCEQFHGVNIKLMKTGSLLKARDLIVEAKKFKMKSMMGCMIETSIGISYGMLFGGMVEYVDLDGFLLIDDPYKMVSESDGILSLKD